MSAVPALVLLHGWGAHGGIWGEVEAELRGRFAVSAPDFGDAATATAAVELLAAAAPARCVVAGWSLGGQLALAWARRFPRQVARLVLLATTPKFVADGGWMHGMAAAAFADFAALAGSDADAALHRFRLLETRGDRRARTVIRRIDRLLGSRCMPAAAARERMLGWLRDTDLRDGIAAIAQPALVVHGNADRIVPPAAGDWLAAHLPSACALRVPGAAHAPFISDPAAVCNRIAEFCNES